MSARDFADKFIQKIKHDIPRKFVSDVAVPKPPQPVVGGPADEEGEFFPSQTSVAPEDSGDLGDVTGRRLLSDVAGGSPAEGVVPSPETVETAKAPPPVLQEPKRAPPPLHPPNPAPPPLGGAHSLVSQESGTRARGTVGSLISPDPRPPPARRGPPSAPSVARGSVAFEMERNELEEDLAKLDAAAGEFIKEHAADDPTAGSVKDDDEPEALRSWIASTDVGGTTAVGASIFDTLSSPSSQPEEQGASSAAPPASQVGDSLVGRGVQRERAPVRARTEEEEKIRKRLKVETEEYRKKQPFGFDLSQNLCSAGKFKTLSFEFTQVLRYDAQAHGIPMTRHGLVCSYRLLRFLQQKHPRHSPSIRDIQYIAENSEKDSGQKRFGLVFENGDEEMQKVLHCEVARAAEAPFYVFAYQGHSNRCRFGGAPKLEDMLLIPGTQGVIQEVRPCRWSRRTSMPPSPGVPGRLSRVVSGVEEEPIGSASGRSTS